MKRKRAARKKDVAKKPNPSVNVDEQDFINFVAQNVQENSVADEINNTNQSNQFNTGKNLKSLSSSSSSDNEGSFNIELDISGDEAAAVSRKKPSVSKQKNGKASVRPSNAPIFPLRESVSNVMSSRGSKGLSSSSRKELTSLKKLSEDPRYNKLELKASLAVIKKVMEMEEAGPFNTPVDPVAQGLPDYFNVIDTPMDFGTIRSNLQNGVKYMNSDDVYKDVNYIWENCSNYNKKGDYIVYLMKRVKKKFMKYWESAGLRSEILEEHNGPSHSMPSSDHDMWQSRHEALSVINRMVSNSNRMQQDSYQSCQPQPRTNQVPPLSQIHAGVGTIYTDMTRGRAHDSGGGGHRWGRDSGGKSKTTPKTSARGGASMFDGARPSGPTFPAPSISQNTQGTHTPQPSSRSPLLPAIFRLIQQLVPPELSPGSESEQEQEPEQEHEPDDAEVEGDSKPGGRTEITVIGDVLLPSQKCSCTIRKVFEKKLHIDGAKWKTVPQDMKEYYFQEFKKHYTWDKSIDNDVRSAWNKKAGKRYRDLMSDMRNKGVRPPYVPEAVWKKWLEVWSDPSYIRMMQQNARNRRNGDENGIAPGCHTGGSTNHLEHRKRLAEKLGRDPTPHELFVYTHTKQHDGKTFVVERAKEVNERVESIKEQMAQNSSAVDEIQVFFEAAGGKVKSKVYGLGLVGQDYYKFHKSKSPTYTSKNEAAIELQKELKELQKLQQSTEERHEERYNLLLETIKKQTELISAMQQRLESTSQIPTADVPVIMSGKKNLRRNSKFRGR